MQAFLVVVVIGCIVAFIGYRIECWSDDYHSQKNENSIGMAVLIIEDAHKIVNKHKKKLNCSTVTMWQYGSVGEGFTVEFYGIDCSIYEKSILDELDSYVGQWRSIDQGDGDFNFKVNFSMDYVGSWNKFNKDVWNEIERKHPSWHIDKVYSHKFILKV